MADTKSTIALEIKVNGDAAAASVGSFKKQLKDANNELLNMAAQFGETSKEAINAAKKVAGLKDAIGDAKALAETFNPDKKFVALGGALQGATAGFSALQGAMGLFGSESKDIEKMLLKVQSAMALQQGISGIFEALDSFKLLGAEIVKSSAFMTINNSVTAITSGLMKLLGISVDTTSMSFKLLKGAIAATGIGLLIIGVGELISAFKDWSEAADKAAQKQKDFDAAQVQSSKDAVSSVTHRLSLEKDLAIAKATTEADKFKIEQDFKRKSIILLQQHYDNTKSLNDKEKEDAVNKINEINIAGQVAALNEQTRIKKENAEKAKEAIRLAKEEEDKLKKKKEQEDKFRLDAFIARQKNDEADAQYLKNQEADDILAEKVKQEKIDKENKTKEEMAAADFQRRLKYLQDIKANADAEKEIDRAKLAAKMEFVDAVAGVLGSLGGLLEKDTALAKTLAIAEIAIGVAKGYINGLNIAQKTAAAQGPGAAFTFPIFYATQIAAVLSAAGKAKGILSSVKGGGGNINTSAPVIAGVSAPIKPQAETTTLSTSSINQIGVASSRAFVLETDVTNNQERIQRLNRAARIN